MSRTKHFFWTLKRKLFVFSIVLLAIPFLSLGLLKQFEEILVDNLFNNLTIYAHSIAFALKYSATEEKASDIEELDNTSLRFYVPTQEESVVTDGFIDDWHSLAAFKRTFADQDVEFRVNLAQKNNHLYIALWVKDDSPVYREVNDQFSLSDQVQIALFADLGNKRSFSASNENQKQGKARTEPRSLDKTKKENNESNRKSPISESSSAQVNLLFAPIAVGVIKPFILNQQIENFWVSDARWQEHDEGYSLEIQLPMHIPWTRLGITVKNYDDQTNQMHESQSFEGLPNALQWPDQAIESRLEQLSISKGQRVWVLNTAGKVLSRRGVLESHDDYQSINPLIHFIFSPPLADFSDPRARSIELTVPAVQQALKGNVGLTLEAIADNKSAIALVAVPIVLEGQVRGVVVVEETVASIQMIQRRAMNVFVNTSLIIMAIVIFLLIILATRFTGRITRLSDQTKTAVDQYGRVKKVFAGELQRDEIGELSRSFAGMSSKLQEYNDYLEKLAARLSHELRTPIAMIRSSLDNMDPGKDSELNLSLNNAKLGVERLSRLIGRMGEAARLEQSVLAAERTPLDIHDFCLQYVAMAQSLYSSHTLTLSSVGKSRLVQSSEEVMAQVLDKLLSNAKDFAPHRTTLEVQLVFRSHEVCLAVINQGPPLPNIDPEQLFLSMISHRGELHKNDQHGHMGLGLYIVRLAAEFHYGRCFARNLEQQQGVIVGIEFPIA